MRSLVLFALFAAAPAAAQNSLDLGDRRVDAIDDPLRIEFRQGTSAPPMERIREAVQAGAQRRDWQVRAKGEGWEVEREVGGRHRVKVEVLCDETGCDIEYVDSVNLLYSERKQAGAPVRAIHRSYNAWVRELAAAIGGAMGAPVTVTVGYARLGDVDAVPFVRDSGRKAYENFLKHPKPRAFAVGKNGAWGWSAPERSPTYLQQKNLDVVGRALERCRRRGEDCRLYAVDDRVVYSDSR